VGANLIHDVGYIESGVTYSAEALVLCDEIISWIKAFKRGAPVNDETLALDLTDKLGFSGDFLSTDHTFRHFKEQWTPSLFNRNTYERWKDSGSPETKETVQLKIERILSEHKCRELSKEVKQKLKAISEKAKKSQHT
jgi:trimethylamine--corrinoid protein Co-methyltransferase